MQYLAIPNPPGNAAHINCPISSISNIVNKNKYSETIKIGSKLCAKCSFYGGMYSSKDKSTLIIKCTAYSHLTNLVNTMLFDEKAASDIQRGHKSLGESMPYRVLSKGTFVYPEDFKEKVEEVVKNMGVVEAPTSFQETEEDDLVKEVISKSTYTLTDLNREAIEVISSKQFSQKFEPTKIPNDIYFRYYSVKHQTLGEINQIITDKSYEWVGLFKK